MTLTSLFILSGSTTYYINTLDTFSRVTLNGAYLTNFYYFWTTSWWSSVVTWVILMQLVFYTLNFYQNGYIFIFIMISGALLLTLLSYWLLNSLNVPVSDNYEYFNLLLLNPINQYHPNLFLLLITLFYFMGFILRLFIQQTSKAGHKVYIHNLLYRVVFKALLISCFTTFLGSWWAYQEGSWGGWWNWDISEYFSLIIVLTYSYMLHRRFIKSGSLLDYSSWLVVVYQLLVLNFYVQYNLTNSSHAFGPEFTRGSVLSRGQLLILSSMMLTAPTVYYTGNLGLILMRFSKSIRWCEFTKLVPQRSYRVWVYSLTYILVYISASVLIKSTTAVANMWGISLLLYTFPWRTELIVLMVAFSLYYWYWSPYLLLPTTYYLTYPVALPLLLIPGYYKNLYKLNLHIILVSALILNLLYAKFNINPSCLTNTTVTQLDVSLEKSYRLSHNIVFDGNWLELSAQYMRLGHPNHTTTPTSDLTSGDASTYYFYLPADLVEQQLCIRGFYTSWAGLDYDFLVPVLSSLGFLFFANSLKQLCSCLSTKR
jgi:hypothetical protein